MVNQNFFPTRMLAASTPSSNSYKALVCINLDGGNDGNNTIVPLSSQAFAKYAAARQQLALEPSTLLAVGDGHGAAYGFHPSLVNVQRSYLAGNSAVVANVGSLLAPITRSAFLSNTVPSPSFLEDHEIQRAQWGTAYCQTDGSSPAHTGWGGRVADLMSGTRSSSFPVVTSVVGQDPFCVGSQTMPLSVAPGNTGGFPTDGSGNDLQLIANLSSGSKLVGAASAGLKDALQQSSLLTSALASAQPFRTVFPKTQLGAQLSQVASILSVHSGLGMNRQIFLCKQTGFDVHAAQLTQHAALLAEFDQAVGAFMNFLVELGLMNEVTIFTQSDFGRSLAMNGAGGSDHAWGNHQMVLGGAIEGNQVYGKFPDLTLAGPDDIEQTGRWIPSSSIEQYASPIASWFGVPQSAMGQVFPNIGAFTPGTLPFIR